MIDAKEGRDVATADVEGAYLHADMEDFVILKLAGEAVDIMCQVNPKYKKFVVVEHGKKVLYLQLLKALYGCFQSALLWYELFTSTLVDMGFKLNPYDPCVANSQIKGKQCTAAWYVDDNKISHVDDTVVTDVIENKVWKNDRDPRETSSVSRNGRHVQRRRNRHAFNERVSKRSNRRFGHGRLESRSDTSKERCFCHQRQVRTPRKKKVNCTTESSRNFCTCRSEPGLTYSSPLLSFVPGFRAAQNKTGTS